MSQSTILLGGVLETSNLYLEIQQRMVTKLSEVLKY